MLRNTAGFSPRSPAVSGRSKIEIARLPLISAGCALVVSLPDEAVESQSAAPGAVRQRSRVRVQQRPESAASG
jgi:hypothetical protein